MLKKNTKTKPQYFLIFIIYVNVWVPVYAALGLQSELYGYNISLWMQTVMLY